jgi:hypothetical protein
VYEPIGVVGEVMMVQMLVNDGLPKSELNEADAPEGSPDTESFTI